MKKILTIFLSILVVITTITFNIVSEESQEIIEEQLKEVNKNEEEIIEPVLEEVDTLIEESNQEHTWTYEGSGNTITATNELSETVYFTIDKPEDLVYTGQPIYASLSDPDDAFTIATGIDETKLSITYSKYGDPIDPINIGVYDAKITCENATAKVSYFITRKLIDPYELIENYVSNDVVYDGQVHYGLGLSDEELPLGVCYNYGSILFPHINKAINAGTYEGELDIDDDNCGWGHDGVQIFGPQKFTWSIAKAPANIVFENEDDYKNTQVYGRMYDQPYKYKIVDSNNNQINKIEDTILRTLLRDVRLEQGKDVGEYKISVQKKEDAITAPLEKYLNYYINEINEGTLYIEPAPLTLSLNITKKEYDGYKFLPGLKISGLKYGDKLTEKIDYHFVRYDETLETTAPSIDTNKDLTTKKEGKKVALYKLTDTKKANNYVLKNVDENDIVTLYYEITSLKPKTNNKVPTSKSQKAITVRTYTSLINKLISNRFSR